MPLILATGAPTASGHTYRDIVGVQYAFPRRYRRAMVPGTPFVYYRGRRSKSLGLPGPAYFGTAILGDAPDTGEEELLAEVLDYVEFETSVGIKRADGSYLEPGVGGNPSYWRRGVRRIDDATMRLIITAARLVAEVKTPVADAPATLPKRYRSAAAAYARDKSAMDAVEAYSVGVVEDLLCAEFGPDAVMVMPHDNPGFDVLVSRPGKDLHVEVKGTRQPNPVFFISEGERRHSFSTEQDYRLCVVAGVNLGTSTHVVHWHKGPILEESIALRPRVWEGRIVLSEKSDRSTPELRGCGASRTAGPSRATPAGKCD